MAHPPTLVHAAVHTLVSAVSVFLVAKVLPGLKVRSLGSALGFALVVALLNAAAWTYLAPLTEPYEWLGLGVGGVVLNGLVFLVAARIVGGVQISGCVMAAIASVAVTFVNHVIQHLLRHVRFY